MDKEIDFIMSSEAYNEAYNDFITAVEKRKYKKMIALRRLTRIIKDIYPEMSKVDVQSLAEELEEIVASSLK